VALGLGAGTASRVSMGIAVVGGMIFATGLTLYVIPAFYSYLSKEKQTAASPAAAPLPEVFEQTQRGAR
jgi:multidrug efflux pump